MYATLAFIAGSTFPRSHTRRYIRRSAEKAGSWVAYPAAIMMGTHDGSDFDTVAELVFDSEADSLKLMEVCGEAGTAMRIAADEEEFLDRAKRKIMLGGHTSVTKRDKLNV